VHRPVFDEQALFESASQHGPVRDRLVEVRVPGVKVGIEMQQCDWPVRVVDSPQQREGDGVIAADRDELLVLCQQRLRLLFDLLDC